MANSRFASSAALLGSLRTPTTETQLPLLDSHAQAALRSGSLESRTLQITVRRSDELPFGVYTRPIVRVHVVDRRTGRALQPPLVTLPGRLADIGDNAFQWRQSLELAVEVREALSPRTVVLFEVVEEKNLRKTRTFGRDKFQQVSDNQDECLDDETLADGAIPRLPVKLRRIAWGFFHGVTEHGALTLPRLMATASAPPRSVQSTRKTSSGLVNLRLQLFEYQTITWMDEYQARAQWGWRRSHPTVPAVFLQYQKRSRQAAPTTLHLHFRLAQANPPHSTTSSSSSGDSPAATASASGGETAAEKQDGVLTASTASLGDAALPVATEASTAEATQRANSDDAQPHEADCMLKCKREQFEPCLVPRRVLHSLPSGKQGCSSLAFSPCGRMLAAGVKTGLGECHLNIYDVGTGARLSIGRGHCGVIYSIEWAASSRDDAEPALFLASASADGTARLWQLSLSSDGQAPGTARPRLSPVREWLHVPSPCYVYCAVFHPSDVNVVVTGASDGLARFHSRLSPACPSSRSATLRVSGAAVQSVRLDGPSRRLFCGDAAGTIAVFSCPADPLDARGYARIKSIATGQASITSLQLHPRKGHLLAHAQPGALLQFELRSYLLLHRSYAGVACETSLGTSVFSADGKWVASGSEDGSPRLYASLHGQEVVAGIWGSPFFPSEPVSAVAWSPTAHMAALGSFGWNSPVVVLCASRGAAADAMPLVEAWSSPAVPSSDVHDDPLLGGSGDLGALPPPPELPLDGHARRVQQILERRRRRLQAQARALPANNGDGE